jgi:PD-(D/E)XK nuclease superfamily protein
VLITNSQVKTWNRCKRQYWYKHGRMLLPKTAALPLKRGSWIHELLEAHYIGDGWEKKNEELTVAYNRLFDEEKELYGDLPTLCGNIMKSYCYHWREEDSNLQVIAAEEVVQVPLPHGHVMEFKFDLIVEDDWGRWLVEHKTHRTLPQADFRFIDMQTGKYVWGLNKLGKYGEITGVLWNYCRTKVPTKPHLNKNGELSKKKIDTDLFTFVSAIKEYDLDPHEFRDVILRLKDHNTFFRRERVPKPKKVIETLVKETVYVADEIERGYKPIRSIERSCEFSCPYLALCVVELYGGDADEVIRNKYRKATSEDWHGYRVDDEEE